MPYAHFQIVKVGDVDVVHLPDDVTERVFILEMTDELLGYVESEQPSKVVVNFSQVTMFGSEAIGALIRMARRIRELGGEVRLCQMNEFTRKIFQIVGLDGTVFQIDDTTGDATGSF